MLLFLIKLRLVLAVILSIPYFLNSAAQADEVLAEEKCAPFLHISCGLPMERPDLLSTETWFPTSEGWKQVRFGPRVGYGWQSDDRQMIVGAGGGVAAQQVFVGPFARLKF